ncbi:hypothetical protein Tco_0828112 [Tanacetum coccineum]
MLPQTSVPLDHEADEAVHKEGMTVTEPGAKIPHWEVQMLKQGLRQHLKCHNGTNSGIDGNLYLIDKKGSYLRGSKDCSRQSDHQIEIEELRHSTDKSLGEDASKQGRNDDKIEELNLTDGADTEVIMEDMGSGEKGGSTADQKLAQRLHEEELAELDKAQKERQKQEEVTSAALAEEFDKIQARIDVDHECQQQAKSTKKRPRADSEEESSKKQKLEEDNDAEKEELRDSIDVVPKDDVAIDVESLATKYPIVDWKTHILNENMIMKICPLTQEMLSRVLNRILEVDYESEMAFELLRFTRSQLQK